MKSRTPSKRLFARQGLLTDVSGLKRTIAGRFSPKGPEEVLAAIQMARREKAVLHPISCGKNWGFGSHLPVENSAVLLDLSQMQAIRRIDWEQDYVELEPGVTQGMLDDALAEHGRTHYFNVTGAGRQTSVIGNALERGIGYFGGKEGDILDLQIALGDGSLFWTSEVSNNPLHTGLGPDLKGLFFQTHFGVVTGARIKLRKRPECMGVIFVPLLPQVSLTAFIDQIVTLRREKIFDSVPHVGNRQRMISTFGAAWQNIAGTEMAAAIPEWSCVIPVTGSKAIVQSIFGEVAARMEGLSHCQLISPDFGEIDPRYINLVDLALGIPNDFALPAVSYAALAQAPAQPIDIDADRAGLVHITPTCPARGHELHRLLSLIDQLRGQCQIKELPMTLNLVNGGMITVVISIPFDRESAEGATRARRLGRRLLEECGRYGFVSYRLGLEDAAHLPPMTEARARVLQALQKVFDPDGIFAPSKYHPLWTRTSAPAPTSPTPSRSVSSEPLLEVYS